MKHLDSDSRLLAETHYQLGLTYSLNLQYSPAIKELESSISVIKSRLGKQGWPLPVSFHLDKKHVNLSSTHVHISLLFCKLMFPLYLAGKLQELLDKAEGPEALPDERKEMEELKALLPEIQEKVEDATEGLKTVGTAAEALKGVQVSEGCGILI